MLNYVWGKEAFDRFPELIGRFNDVDSPYLLWFELTHAFKEAYNAPRNDDLIARIYDFAKWCCSQSPGTTAEDDLGTCVCVCFFEHIPESPGALEDMPRWFSHSEVLVMKDTFSHMVGEEGFQRILHAYEGQAQRRTEPKR